MWYDAPQVEHNVLGRNSAIIFLMGMWSLQFMVACICELEHRICFTRVIFQELPRIFIVGFKALFRQVTKTTVAIEVNKLSTVLNRVVQGEIKTSPFEVLGKVYTSLSAEINKLININLWRTWDTISLTSVPKIVGSVNMFTVYIPPISQTNITPESYMI